MEKAVVALLSKPVTHPYAVLPLLLQVIGTDATTFLICVGTQGKSIDIAGRMVGCLDTGFRGTAYSSQCKEALQSVATALRITKNTCHELHSLLEGWLRQEQSMNRIRQKFPELFTLISDGLNSTESCLSVTRALQLLDCSTPLSLTGTPFTKLLTFTEGARRRNVVDNILALWTTWAEADIEASVFIEVRRALCSYLRHICIGMPLKALRWIEVYSISVLVAYAVRSRFQCAADWAFFEAVIDFFYSLLSRYVSSGSLTPASDACSRFNDQDRPVSRPSTASSTRLGRLGDLGQESERVELLSIIADLGRSLADVIQNCHAHFKQKMMTHPLWEFLGSFPFSEIILPAEQRLFGSLGLMLWNSGLHTLKNVIGGLSFISIPAMQTSEDISPAYCVSFCRLTMNFLVQLSSCLPELLNSSECLLVSSVIGELCMFSAIEVCGAMCSEYHIRSATERQERYQQALVSFCPLHRLFCDGAIDLQVMLAVVHETIATVGVDSVSRDTLQTLCSTTTWLYWHFASVSNATMPNESTSKPVLEFESYDADSTSSVLTGLCTVLESTVCGGPVVIAALQALSVLYHVADLDTTDTVERHIAILMSRMTSLTDCEENDMLKALGDATCSFVAHQRINISLHASFDVFADMIEQLLTSRNSGSTVLGLCLARSLLSGFDDSSLVSDSLASRLLLRMFETIELLRKASRSDNASQQIVLECASTLREVLSQPRCEGLIEGYPALGDALSSFVRETTDWSSEIVLSLAVQTSLMSLVLKSPARILSPVHVQNVFQQCASGEYRAQRNHSEALIPLLTDALRVWKGRSLASRVWKQSLCRFVSDVIVSDRRMVESLSCLVECEPMLPCVPNFFSELAAIAALTDNSLEPLAKSLLSRPMTLGHLCLAFVSSADGSAPQDIGIIIQIGQGLVERGDEQRAAFFSVSDGPLLARVWKGNDCLTPFQSLRVRLHEVSTLPIDAAEVVRWLLLLWLDTAASVVDDVDAMKRLSKTVAGQHGVSDAFIKSLSNEGCAPRAWHPRCLALLYASERQNAAAPDWTEDLCEALRSMLKLQEASRRHVFEWCYMHPTHPLEHVLNDACA